MSSPHFTMPLNSNSTFDELRWVIQIRRALDEELEDENGILVSIFNVPKTLISTHPEAYIPQQVALGPYHHWRLELYEMERYKLSAAKRTQRQLQNLKFHHLVDNLTKLEHRIRAYYHRFLDFNGETLAWMMAVDASFLIEFLQIYTVKEGKILTRISSRMSHLVDSAGRKSAHNAIIRDVMMLENQIPIFVLRKFLAFQCSSPDIADDLLSSMLIGFCKALSPFKMMENFPNIQVIESAHLLEFLYHILVPKSEEACEIEESDDLKEIIRDADDSFMNSGNFRQLFDAIWSFGSSLKGGPFHYLKKAILSRPMKFIVKIPWKIITNLPGFSIIKGPIESFFSSEDKENFKSEEEGSTINRPPLIEEITIPSITELRNAGIKFTATNGDILTVNFVEKSAILYLPTISLDVNTEVILRNLVAYEASAASGPLIFTRYTELMNGIIDTEEDVKLLRESGVVLNRLKSDEEVANLWNGMSKSVRLTKVPFLDKVIEDVNRYYSCRWRVKIGKFMKRYVFGSWPILAFLAAVLLLLLTSLQAFCSVYSCARWFRVQTSD
ncbi:transmembrane protein, putative (DUF247) [Tasmannia lanceolata]|uniref:transmembrane protein, putative (DUF247) n=1 Tax=Tasmannia lanceolata TaxID=3420 RepID=UPI004062D108